MRKLRHEPAIVIGRAVLIAVLAGLLACTSEEASPVSGEDTSTPTGGVLRLATTTSLDDTGLWDYLEPIFEDRFGVSLQVIPAGTGKALEFGRRGDVDVVTIHSRLREEEFVAQGYGTQRNVIAYNYFAIVGPESDPAGIKGLGPVDAFVKLIEHGAADPGNVWFVSRGDNSGTHDREQSIWQEAGYEYEAVRNSGEWYLELGTGMGPTLLLANERSAYVLTDMSTYLALEQKLELVPLVERSPALLNVYSVIPIDPRMHPNVNSVMAEVLVEFLTSDEIQDLIAQYGIVEFGQPLFIPARGRDPG